MITLPDDLYWIVLAGSGLALVASVAYRAWMGKPLLYGTPTPCLFAEGHVSGTSYRAWNTRLGGARFALVVSVTPEHLIVRPFFPFNLFFLPEVLDLEHTIPLDSLRGATPARRLGREGVEVLFEHASGHLRRIWLGVRHRDAFFQALNAAQPR